METSVELDHVWKSRGGDFKLGPLGLSLETGKILGVMGPNGAGKTTMIHLIWGFFPPDSGDIRVFGEFPHRHRAQLRQSCGYVSESPVFYDTLSATRFLRFIAGFYERWDAERAQQLLERLGVDPAKPIGDLSKGNRTKLALVAAIAHRPKLLVLDEPSTGLDPIVRTEVMDMLIDLARNEGTSIILSSHVSDDIDRTADTVLMLEHGEPIEFGAKAELLSRHNSNRTEDVFLDAVRQFRSQHTRHPA
jgi:ABC-2 type transport system ATP-binding protein